MQGSVINHRITELYHCTVTWCHVAFKYADNSSLSSVSFFRHRSLLSWPLCLLISCRFTFIASYGFSSIWSNLSSISWSYKTITKKRLTLPMERTPETMVVNPPPACQDTHVLRKRRSAAPGPGGDGLFTQENVINTTTEDTGSYKKLKICARKRFQAAIKEIWHQYLIQKPMSSWRNGFQHKCGLVQARAEVDGHGRMEQHGHTPHGVVENQKKIMLHSGVENGFQNNLLQDTVFYVHIKFYFEGMLHLPSNQDLRFLHLSSGRLTCKMH